MNDQKLVRVWDRDYKPRGQQFVAWNHGTFTIPTDDPLAVELWDNRERGHQITVESTDELAWWVDRMDKMADGTLDVTCRPHVDMLRYCITPDWKLVSAWLEAEKAYRQNRFAVRTIKVLQALGAFTAETAVDPTWRIIGREVARNVHPAIDGQDCYVFKRDGGARSTDIWSVTYTPVVRFWG
jgi:hypothetical protein